MFQVRGAERRRRENRPGGPGACSPRKCLISDSLKRVFLHFGISFSLLDNYCLPLLPSPISDISGN